MPAKLILHMPENGGPDQNISIAQCARQLGLKPGEYGHHGMMFRGGQGLIPEETDYTVKGNASLVGFYNLADLLLTTTKGEGWGLSITEALACGTPVAMPDHTSCAEIGGHLDSGDFEDMWCCLPVEKGVNVDRADNSRLRPRVDLERAVDALENYYKSGAWKDRKSMSAPLKSWLDWDRIAGEMLKLFKKVPATVKASAPAATATDFIEFGEMEVCQ